MLTEEAPHIPKKPMKQHQPSPSLLVTKISSLIFTGDQSLNRGSSQVGVLVTEVLTMTGISTIVNFDYE